MFCILYLGPGVSFWCPYTLYTCKFVIILVQPLWLRQSWIYHDFILCTLQLLGDPLGQSFLGLVSLNNGITFNKQTESDRKQDTPPLPRFNPGCLAFKSENRFAVLLHRCGCYHSFPFSNAGHATFNLCNCDCEMPGRVPNWRNQFTELLGSWTWQRLCLNNAFWTILLSFTMVYFGTNSFRKEFLNILLISSLENNLTPRFNAANLDGIESTKASHQATGNSCS